MTTHFQLYYLQRYLRLTHLLMYSYCEQPVALYSKKCSLTTLKQPKLGTKTKRVPRKDRPINEVKQRKTCKLTPSLTK